VIPRVARSGQSFQGAGQYYLHDKANAAFQGIGDYALHDKRTRQTSNRVGFTAILNMEAKTAQQAIQQMTASYDAYRKREANKRGRKLTQPVYVYSLSWSPEQTPDKDEMLEAAHSSLKALRLEGLQTLIVQHTDEPQPHIHIIVNRIERDGSRARNIPFDKLRFSRWAEQYEREHGRIFCEQRVENNQRRQQGEFVKDTVSLTQDQYVAREKAQRLDKAQWERDLNRASRDDEQFIKRGQQLARETLVQKHQQERNALHRKTQNRIVFDIHRTRKRFRKSWTAQAIEAQQRFLELKEANKHGIFERAVFVFRHKEYLKKWGGGLRMRDIARMCLSKKFAERYLAAADRNECASLRKWETSQTKTVTKMAWVQHREEFQQMNSRHQLERDLLLLKQQHFNENRAIDPRPRIPHMGAYYFQPSEQQHATQIDAKPVKAPELSNGANLNLSEAEKLLTDPPALKNIFAEEAFKSSGQAHADAVIKRSQEYRKKNRDGDFGRSR
jgi:hypothetical protein